MKSNILGLLTVGLLMGPMGAGAVTVGGTYNFTASGFPIGAPVNTVVGSFTITFDNSGTIANSTAGFSLNSINIAPSAPGTVGYYYNHVNDVLFVGGLINNVNVLPIAGVTDWVLRITSFSSAPAFSAFSYSQEFATARWGTETGSVAVPEPGTLALLGLGLLGLGLTRRKTA